MIQTFPLLSGTGIGYPVLIIVSRSSPLLSNNRHPFFSGQVQEQEQREPLSGNGKKNLSVPLLSFLGVVSRPCKIAFNEPQESGRDGRPRPRVRPSILFKEGKEGGLKSRINLEWPRFEISLMS